MKEAGKSVSASQQKIVRRQVERERELRTSSDLVQVDLLDRSKRLDDLLDIISEELLGLCSLSTSKKAPHDQPSHREMNEPAAQKYD
jgi:hypothetical protein